MPNGTHYLIVPPDGLLEVVHSDGLVDVVGALRTRTQGSYVCLRFSDEGVAHWLHHDTGQINPRARQAVAILSGMHMIFTGPVIITGVDETSLGRVVAALSLRSVTEP